MNNLEQLKQEMVLACQRLWQRGLVANHDGNISYKLDSPAAAEAHFLVTPTSFCKADVKISDLLVINELAKVLEGPHKVFSEWSWHRLIYSLRTDIKCIIHAHPPAATGIALAQKEIGVPALPEAIVSLGRGIFSIPFFPPAAANKDSAFYSELRASISQVLSESDAFLVPGNGVWAVGSQITQTYLRAELVEQVALAHTHAATWGGAKPLPKELVEELLAKRPKSEIIARPSMDQSSQPLPAINAETIRALVRAELEKL